MKLKLFLTGNVLSGVVIIVLIALCLSAGDPITFPPLICNNESINITVDFASGPLGSLLFSSKLFLNIGRNFSQPKRFKRNVRTRCYVLYNREY